jgi:hypothetical protein
LELETGESPMKLETSSSAAIFINIKLLSIMKENKNIWEILIRVVIAALTAALTAVTTTSCIGHGPF